MSAVLGRPAVDTDTETARTPRGVIPLSLWLLMAGLAFNLFSGRSDELGLPIGLDRLFLPAALVVVVLEKRRLRWPPAHLFVLFAAFVGTATWSALGYRVWADTEAAFALLDRVYVPFVLCLLAPSVLSTAYRRRVFLWFLTGVGLYLSLTTIAQYAGAWSLVWPPYARASGTTAAAYRAGGPFMSSEANGLALLMCAFAAAALVSQVRGLRQVVPMGVSVLAVVSSVLGMTRSVWLAAVVAVLVFLVCSPRVGRRLWLVGLALAAAAVATNVLFPDFVQSLVQRSTESSSLYDREATNVAALRIMAEQPLTGVGWRQFVDVGWDWLRQGDTIPLSHTHIEVHNIFLARGAELGIPALLLYAACLLLGPVRAVLRPRVGELGRWRAFAAASLAAWCVPALLSPNPYPFPTFLTWLATGVLLGPGESAGPTRTTGRVGAAPADGAQAAGPGGGRRDH